jgi:hypothetical protein
MFQSIRRYSVAAKHCSRIVLKVFDGLRPLIHLPTTKTESVAAMINGKAATMELT